MAAVVGNAPDNTEYKILPDVTGNPFMPNTR